MSESNGEAKTTIIASDIPADMQEFQMADIHEISLEILDFLEAGEVDVPLGTIALALTLGRVVSPAILQPEDEIKFIEGIMSYVQLYFMKGTAN